MTTFLIADSHFCHEGIIRLCGRPFSDVSEMDAAMVDSWNAVVRKDDTVIHLGDFAHRAAADRLPKLFNALNGRKHLIRGNHDGEATLMLPWESISEVVHASIDSTVMTLCHYAWRVWPRQRRGAIMLYGHSHGRLPGDQRSMDVGVDVVGYKPLRVAEVKAYLAALPPFVDPEVGGADLENDSGGLTP